MSYYDRVDWHVEAAEDAGQPEEQAFTHIGLFLAWAIRRKLHNRRLFAAEHVAALLAGEMTGSDLQDDIDGKLAPDLFTREGQRFAEARYADYVNAFNGLFPGLPDYGVVDDATSAAVVEPFLDRLYADWVAAGRPKPEPQPDLDLDLEPTSEEMAAFEAHLQAQMEQSERMREEVRTSPSYHRAPELERLVPAELFGPIGDSMSVTAAEHRSSQLNRSLKRLGVKPRDAIVAWAMGETGAPILTVYRVPGQQAADLQREFEGSSFPGYRWMSRQVGDRVVRWAERTGKPRRNDPLSATYAFAQWAEDEHVIELSGEDEWLERAIPLVRVPAVSPTEATAQAQPRAAQLLDPSASRPQGDPLHIAPDLESLVPDDLFDAVRSRISQRLEGYDRLTTASLRKVGAEPASAVVVDAQGWIGRKPGSVLVFRVPGVEPARFADELAGHLRRASDASHHSMAGHDVLWLTPTALIRRRAEIDPGSCAIWVHDGLIWQAAGPNEWLEAAVLRLLEMPTRGG